MTEGLVTFISYLCIFVGLCATAAYAVTFYMTNYNELYLSGQSGYDETDAPYTYAIIEAAFAAATALVGILGFVTTGRPSKRALMVCVFFFSTVSILEGALGTMRAVKLGLVGDDVGGTCSDIGKATGCPTTRFEDVHGRAITYTEPLGGDCVFWFWGLKPTMGGVSGNNMKRFTDITIDNEKLSKTTFLGISQRRIETYMDWSEPTSYGWRDDPDEISSLAETSNLDSLMLNKRHNMQEIMDIQKKAQLSEELKLTHAPSLSYCWYWGCNSVCHQHRYLVNRWWLLSSVSLLISYIIALICTVVLWRKTPTSEKAVDAYVSEEDPEELLPPLRGRRKRQLVQNPSGLMF